MAKKSASNQKDTSSTTKTSTSNGQVKKDESVKTIRTKPVNQKSLSPAMLYVILPLISIVLATLIFNAFPIKEPSTLITQNITQSEVMEPIQPPVETTLETKKVVQPTETPAEPEEEIAEIKPESIPPSHKLIEEDLWVPRHDKYASDLVRIQRQELVTPPPDGASCPIFEVEGDIVSVEEAMEAGPDALREKQLVLFMLNGENEGIYVKWNQQEHAMCVNPMAYFAAEKLGADINRAAYGLRLYSQAGYPIVSALDLDVVRIAHVLFDFQLWVWPGIKVGYEQDVRSVIDGSLRTMRMRTQSLKPKVFTVYDFFNEKEAAEIISYGTKYLTRSPVDSPEADAGGFHRDRTSDTAFLPDTEFTRRFRHRVASFNRLPAASYVERLQLVRYQEGQFFRQHEDYFYSKKLLPTQELARKEYVEWTKWASKKIDEAVENGEDIPSEFRKGGMLYPDAENLIDFQVELLTLFLKEAEKTDFFWEHVDVEWGAWIKENVELRANDILEVLLADKGYMLPHIIKAWEAKLNKGNAFKYTIPPRPLSGVTMFFRWIRWVKEKIQERIDSCGCTNGEKKLDEEFRPDGVYYPTYNRYFQNILVNMVLEDKTKEELTEALENEELVETLMTKSEEDDVLLKMLQKSTAINQLVIDAWTKRAGPEMHYEPEWHYFHFEPNRFLTMFLYLNECEEGGETVFPYSRERISGDKIKREGMAECSEGLAVPPTVLTTSLFYHQTPEHVLDPLSRHGGCPPARGVKYGANAFTWNVDAEEGANLWNLGEDLKAPLYVKKGVRKSYRERVEAEKAKAAETAKTE